MSRLGALVASTSLWRDQRFRRYWSAQGISEFGDRITELAVPLIAVTVLDASASQVGLLTAAVWLPNLISLMIGTWVDHRPDKRRLMIVADLIRSAVLLTLPVAYWLDALTLAHLYAIALLTGTAHVLFITANASYYVRVVRREQYLEATGKLSATRSLSFMAGPAVGGALVQWLTAPIAIVVDAATFVFSAIQLKRTRPVEPEPGTSEPAGEAENLWRRAAVGLRYVLRHPYLRVSLACATTVNFFNLISTALLVLYASRHLDLSAGTIGLAFGIGAVGGFVGAVTAGSLARRLGAGRVIAFGAVVFPGAIAIVALADGPLWVRAGALALTEFVASFAVMCFDVPLNALQTAVLHDHMRSRAVGAFTSINYGIRPLGAVVGGLLGTWIGVRETLLISAAGGLLAVLWLVRSPILRTRSLTGLEPPEGVLEPAKTTAAVRGPGAL